MAWCREHSAEGYELRTESGRRKKKLGSWEAEKVGRWKGIKMGARLTALGARGKNKRHRLPK